MPVVGRGATPRLLGGHRAQRHGHGSMPGWCHVGLSYVLRADEKGAPGGLGGDDRCPVTQFGSHHCGLGFRYQTPARKETLLWRDSWKKWEVGRDIFRSDGPRVGKGKHQVGWTGQGASQALYVGKEVEASGGDM